MAKKKTAATASESPQAGQEPLEVSQDLLAEKTATTAPESPQAGQEPLEVSQDLLAEETAPERTMELVRCRVSWPGGVYLREGPGGAYCGKTVLPAGTEVLSADVADLLRKERAPDASMWLKVLSPAGSGWVDGAYLERLDESAE